MNEANYKTLEILAGDRWDVFDQLMMRYEDKVQDYMLRDLKKGYRTPNMRPRIFATKKQEDRAIYVISNWYLRKGYRCFQ